MSRASRGYLQRVRIVVKIGSSSLVDPVGGCRLDVIEQIATDIATVASDNVHVVLVSSGAIATGLGVLGRRRRPDDLPSLQAASAVGQGALFSHWSAACDRHGIQTAQVLLTMHDAAQRAAWVNARTTLEQLIAWRVVPIVNENDTTATDEITFGDNDTLAAQVAVSLRADLLVLLTDTDGIYTEHPDSPTAQRIERVDDRSLLHRIDVASPGSHWGSGGMRSKIIATEMASQGGVDTVVTASTHARILQRLRAGESLGTRIIADARRGSSFKFWLRHAKRTAGTLTVDDGARDAIVLRGASLLAVGVTSVDGAFRAGDAVDILTGSGDVVAKGIVDYDAAELRGMLIDAQTRRRCREVIHRDQLVLITAVSAST